MRSIRPPPRVNPSLFEPAPIAPAETLPTSYAYQSSGDADFDAEVKAEMQRQEAYLEQMMQREQERLRVYEQRRNDRVQPSASPRFVQEQVNHPRYPQDMPTQFNPPSATKPAVATSLLIGKAEADKSSRRAKQLEYRAQLDAATAGKRESYAPPPQEHRVIPPSQAVVQNPRFVDNDTQSDQWRRRNDPTYVRPDPGEQITRNQMKPQYLDESREYDGRVVDYRSNNATSIGSPSRHYIQGQDQSNYPNGRGYHADGNPRGGYNYPSDYTDNEQQYGQQFAGYAPQNDHVAVGAPFSQPISPARAKLKSDLYGNGDHMTTYDTASSAVANERWLPSKMPMDERSRNNNIAYKQALEMQIEEDRKRKQEEKRKQQEEEKRDREMLEAREAQTTIIEKRNVRHQANPDSHPQMQANYEISSPSNRLGGPSSPIHVPPGAAREKLKTDVYGNGAHMTTFDVNASAAVNERWLPSKGSVDEKSRARNLAHKQALDMQIEEVRRRKEEEKEKLKKEEERERRMAENDGRDPEVESRSARHDQKESQSRENYHQEQYPRNGQRPPQEPQSYSSQPSRNESYVESRTDGHYFGNEYAPSHQYDDNTRYGDPSTSSPRSPANAHARQRLRTDIYGNGAHMITHDPIASAAVNDGWVPSKGKIDDKTRQANDEHKQALDRQVEEMRRRKEEEKEREKMEDFKFQQKLAAESERLEREKREKELERKQKERDEMNALEQKTHEEALARKGKRKSTKPGDGESELQISPDKGQEPRGHPPSRVSYENREYQYPESGGNNQHVDYQARPSLHNDPADTRRNLRNSNDSYRIDRAPEPPASYSPARVGNRERPQYQQDNATYYNSPPRVPYGGPSQYDSYPEQGRDRGYQPVMRRSFESMVDELSQRGSLPMSIASATMFRPSDTGDAEETVDAFLLNWQKRHSTVDSMQSLRANRQHHHPQQQQPIAQFNLLPSNSIRDSYQSMNSRIQDNSSRGVRHVNTIYEESSIDREYADQYESDPCEVSLISDSRMISVNAQETHGLIAALGTQVHSYPVQRSRPPLSVPNTSSESNLLEKSLASESLLLYIGAPSRPVTAVVQPQVLQDSGTRTHDVESPLSRLVRETEANRPSSTASARSDVSWNPAYGKPGSAHSNAGRDSLRELISNQSRPTSSKLSMHRVGKEYLGVDDDEANSIGDEELLVIPKSSLVGAAERDWKSAESLSRNNSHEELAGIRPQSNSARISRPSSGQQSRAYTPIGESSGNVNIPLSRNSSVAAQPVVNILSRPNSVKSISKPTSANIGSRPSSKRLTSRGRNGALSSSDKLYMSDEFEKDEVLNPQHGVSSHNDDDDDDLGANSYVWDNHDYDASLDAIINADHQEHLAQLQGEVKHDDDLDLSISGLGLHVRSDSKAKLKSAAHHKVEPDEYYDEQFDD